MKDFIIYIGLFIIMFGIIVINGSTNTKADTPPSKYQMSYEYVASDVIRYENKEVICYKGTRLDSGISCFKKWD